ncbi:MAG: ComF family protein [Thermotaleaceae bacterium]
MGRALWELREALLDFVYPRNIFCILCGEGIEKTERYSLCPLCKEQITFVHERTCQQCGKPLEELYLPSECPDCILSNHSFTQGYTCVIYDEEIKRLIYRFKYGKQRYLAYHLAEIMIDKLKEKEVEEIHWVLPVPLHKKRRQAREFNQSEILAKYISREMGWPMDSKNLIRMKDTQTQNQLSKEERKANMKNVFQIVQEDKIKAKKILLIDDIYTTGSTLDSCSKVLLRAGAKEVYTLTFAAGRSI